MIILFMKLSNIIQLTSHFDYFGSSSVKNNKLKICNVVYSLLKNFM